MSEQHCRKSHLSPFWVMLGVAGAATAAALIWRRSRESSNPSIESLVQAADRAAKTLEERLMEYQLTG